MIICWRDVQSLVLSKNIYHPAGEDWLGENLADQVCWFIK